MIELLQNKNSSTRFQVLVEIALSGPGVSQRNIATKLGITPQAVSEYIRQLVDEKLLSARGRQSYSISIEGVNWMLRMSRELSAFLAEAASAVRNITTCAAIADSDLAKGQVVRLLMRDGILMATAEKGRGAKGTATSSARAGEDVGISNIEGLVELTRGKITLLEVPTIMDGGSKNTDLTRLKKLARNGAQAGAVGIEALAAMRKSGIQPRYTYGVAAAAIEQARCGLPFVIVAASDALPELVRKLRDSELEHEVIPLGPTRNTRS